MHTPKTLSILLHSTPLPQLQCPLTPLFPLTIPTISLNPPSPGPSLTPIASTAQSACLFGSHSLPAQLYAQRRASISITYMTFKRDQMGVNGNEEVKAGKEANFNAILLVVRRKIPRPGANDVDVKTQNASEDPVVFEQEGGYCHGDDMSESSRLLEDSCDDLIWCNLLGDTWRFTEGHIEREDERIELEHCICDKEPKISN